MDTYVRRKAINLWLEGLKEKGLREVKAQEREMLLPSKGPQLLTEFLMLRLVCILV